MDADETQRVCAPAKTRRNWGRAVRTSLNTDRVLRELVKQAVTLALTTKRAPATAHDVAIIAEQVAREVIP